jgi:hypothetical protein
VPDHDPDAAEAGADEPGSDDGPDRSGPRWPRGTVAVSVGLVVALAIGAAMGGWLVVRDHTEVRGEAAAEAFFADYVASLDATYRLDGTFRRTMPDGRELTSGLLVAQRPPDRVQRSLGSTTGVVGGRYVNCGPTAADGGYECAPGAMAEPAAVRRAEQLEALEQYVRGDDPVYAVTGDGDGCYELLRRRTEPEASFGVRAELCVDARTGAIRRLEVQHDTGAVDVLEGLAITPGATDADFDLAADGTYDPQGS